MSADRECCGLGTGRMEATGASGLKSVGPGRSCEPGELAHPGPVSLAKEIAFYFKCRKVSRADFHVRKVTLTAGRKWMEE